jgi:hypothetical protein
MPAIITPQPAALDNDIQSEQMRKLIGGVILSVTQQVETDAGPAPGKERELPIQGTSHPP